MGFVVPAVETKQATGSKWWQISTKWLKEDFQKLMKIRRTELLIQQIPENTQKLRSLG